jgi:hypothetical protein
MEAAVTGTTVIVPAISSPDTFVVPSYSTTSEVIKTVPSLSTVDTFVAPSTITERVAFVPALSSVDSMVAPKMGVAYRVPFIFSPDTMLPPSNIGRALKTPCEFPNLEGKHLSLKYFNDDVTGSLILYYARYKLLKYLDHIDSQAYQPNLEGSHLSLKIRHDAQEEFILAYSSMTLLAYKE